MLKHRILSAMVLIPLVLWMILYGNGVVLSGLLAVVLGLAAYEWMRLIPLNRPIEKILYIFCLVMCALGAWRYYTIGLWINTSLWCVLIGCILTYPQTVHLWGYRVVVGIWGLVVLPMTYVSLSRIYNHEHGPELVIYLLFLVWAADTGGYFFGKKWGQKRLIPKVSPGKTLAGVLGGAILLLLVAACGALWFKPQSLLAWLLVASLIFIIALFGDLFISMLKRRVQIKDTGALIPGHGGVLDRIDSLIAAVPAFAFYLSLLPELIK